MTHEEAIKYSLTIPWKVQECFSGPQCWCRMIVPVEIINFTYTLPDGTIQDTLEDIIDSAAIDQKTAEYIVNLHNKRLNNE